ncbi:MAG TPA: DMT family transporter [Acidimicrobiales bacterium]|nr:DMT family transporter [Acidimicrobiales bacterium]
MTPKGWAAPDNQAVGVALGTASGVAFATVAIFAKLGYSKGASALPLLTGRFVVATLLLVLFGLGTRRNLRIPRPTANTLVSLGMVALAFEALLFFAALERAPAAVVGLVFYSYPAWTTLVGFALGLEAISVRTVLALVLGSAGVVTVFSLPDGGSTGLWFALAAALVVAAYLPVAQRVTRDVDPYAGAVWTAIGASAALLGASAVTTSTVPLRATPELLALGFATAIAYVLLYRALGLIGSARASIAMMVEPVATLVLAAIVLDESITPRVAFGATLVVAALLLLATQRRRAVVAEV